MARIENSPIQQSGSGNLIQLIGHSIDEVKSLAQCSVDELRAVEAWRQDLLRRERRRQTWLVLKLLTWLLTGGGATWLSMLWLHWSHWLVLGLGACGVALPAMALYAQSQAGDSEFALRQLGALREIGYLLREKGVA